MKKENKMAEVVWCQSCKTAVWAYDHTGPKMDLRGIMNHLGMPCPKCGEVGNFDGWGSGEQTLEDIQESFPSAQIYDWWSALKEVAKLNCKDLEWEISPDCRWFRRPGDTDEYYKRKMDAIKLII